MANYRDHLERHRRLSLLRCLAETPGYSSNDSLLTQVVNSFGLTSTRDQVRSSLAWMAEQRLVTVDEVSGVMVAKATARGVEIAEGRATHPDVERPWPPA